MLFLDSLDSFPLRYDGYYQDNFPLRYSAINLFGQLQYRIFHTSPVPQSVIMGRNGWFFMNGDEQKAYMGDFKFSPEELENFRLELEYRKEYIERLGGKFYFMVVPSKNVIYSDQMPYTVHPKSKESWGQQLNAYLKAESKVNVIDAYPTLSATHAAEMTYLKLDNHWNERGAFYASNVILETMHVDFPLIAPDLKADFDIVKTVINNGNLSQMFGFEVALEDTMIAMKPRDGFKARLAPNFSYPMVKGFPYPNEFETTFVTQDSTLPRLLLIGDSFGYTIMPFLAEHFSHSVRIFDCWQYKLNANIVQNERADAVVLMVLESNLRNMFEFQAHLKPNPADSLPPLPAP